MIFSMKKEQVFDTVEFGHVLRLARRRRDVRQIDLARASGVSVRALRELERGRATPSAETLARLAVALGLDIQELWPCGQLLADLRSATC